MNKTNSNEKLAYNYEYYNRLPVQKLWNYDGYILDMGIESNEQKKPAFYILTENNEHIQVTITRCQEVKIVINWLNRLKTGIKVEFENYVQFNSVIQNIFEVYCKRFGLIMHFDNTILNAYMKELKGFATESDVARLSGIGKSTMNDLTRGITKRPHFFTVCKVFSAIYKLEHIKKYLDK